MGIDYHYHYPRCTEDHRFDFSAGWSRTRIWSPFQGGREPNVAHLGPLCPKKSDWQSRLEPNVSSGRVSCDVRLSWCPRQHLFKDGEQERALNFSGDDRSLVKLLHPNLPGSLLSSIVSWRRNHLRPWDKNSKTCLYKFCLESWMDEMCPHLHAAMSKVISSAWWFRNYPPPKWWRRQCFLSKGTSWNLCPSLQNDLPSPIADFTWNPIWICSDYSQEIFPAVRDKVLQEKSVTEMPI